MRRHGHSHTVTRIVTAAVVGAAAVLASAPVAEAATPAPAAEPTGLVDVQAPSLTASSTGTSINVSVTNPHSLLSGVGCNALVVNAVDVLGVVSNPLKLLEPGVVVFPNVNDWTSLFGVLPGQTRNYTVSDVNPGLYGVIGTCASIFNIGSLPTIGTPQLLAVTNIDLGSVGSSEVPALGSATFGSSEIPLGSS